MEVLQNCEKPKEIEALRYESKRILDKMTMYKFTASCGFDVPRGEENHESASPLIRTRHVDNFNFAWRLVYIYKMDEYFQHQFIISLLSFDKRHLDVCVRCYVEDESYFMMLMEERAFYFEYYSSESPIEKEFHLLDRDLNSIGRFGRSSYLGVRMDFEFLERDHQLYSSLKLTEDLETLLKQQNDELTDATFVVGGMELKAHKCVLAARSPVFAKMFEAQETHDNKYNIDDIEADVFQHLLTFVYCGETHDASSSNKLMELRLAAEKFGLAVSEKQLLYN